MAQLGTSVKFAFSTNIQTPTWQTLPEVTEVSPPSLEVEDNEGTYYGLTRRIYKPGLSKLGDISVTMYYDPNNTVTQSLITNTGTVILFGLRITESDNKFTFFKFTGFVSKYEIKTPMDQNMEITFSIKPDGDTWVVSNDLATDPLA